MVLAVKIDGARSLHVAWLAPLLAALASCTGQVEPPSNGTPPASPSPTTTATNGAPQPNPAVPPADCSTPSPGPAPLRRLSNAEYANTLRDLFSNAGGLGAEIDAVEKTLPPEAESLGFRNNAEFLTVQSLLAQKYMDAAERLAARAVASDALVPCDPSSDALACGRKFIAEFGQRVYRRALSAEETARYDAAFQSTLGKYDFDEAVEWTVYSMLQSPQFLYRVESGAAGATAGITRPTPNELAVRLSYLFWQSAPDAALLVTAASGGLETPAQVADKAREMLNDPRAGRLFQYFAEWLDLDRLDEFSRDPKVFPNLPAQLPDLLESEARAFVAALLASPSGSFHELLTAPYTYVNRELGSHYGLAAAASDSGFVRVEAPSRSGILTQGFLSSHDKANRTSIVRRGLKVRTDFLCNNVPAPPNDVALDLEGLGQGLSQRERLEQHRSAQECAGCHALMDPIGVVFESFDAVGRERTLDEAGRAIVTASTLEATRDMNGPVANVRELGEKLAASLEVRECYVTQTFRFFFGREVEPADKCTIQKLRQAFATDQSLSGLLVALTQTDAFLYRPVIEEVQP